MEHQEVEPLAKAPVFDEVDNDEDDDEYKVESDADVDDTDSDEADEQEALPLEEVTLHLADIADDLLGGLEEPVLSDSECVESDAEDEDEEGCSGALASQQERQRQQHPAVEGMAERTPLQERGAPAGRHARQAQEQQPAEESADGVAAAPLHGGEAQQLLQQLQPHGVAGCVPAWDSSLGAAAAATPLHQQRQVAVGQAAMGGTGIRLLGAGGPGGDSTPQQPAGGHGLPQQTQAGLQFYAHGFVAEQQQQQQQEPTLQQQLAAVTSLHNQACFGLGAGGALAAAAAAGPIGLQQQLPHHPQQQQPGLGLGLGPGHYPPGGGGAGGGLACPPSGGICRRTRAHVSLRDVDLSELEQQLPAHIDIEEIELAEDDEEYGKFLQSLFDDTAALSEDSSDEDPDFGADLDLSKDDDDDDRGWLKLLHSPDLEEDDDVSAGGWGRPPAADSPARRTRARSRRGNAKGSDGAAGASGEGGGGAPEMTAEQRSILYAQVHCHTQLLVQTYAMFALDRDSEAQDHAAKAKALLEQLAMVRDNHVTTRRAMGLAPFNPDDLLRPPPPPPAVAGAAAPAGSIGGDRTASGTAADSGAAAATTTSDAAAGSGGGRAGRPRAAAATIPTLVVSEASRDDFDWENVDSALADAAAAAGVPAFKAAAAARSAAMGTAVRAFRPAWCPPPGTSVGGVWSVLEVVPLRQFPQVQEIMRMLPALPYSVLKQQRELQVLAKSKRKNRRRRGDDPLAAALEWARPALQCLQGHLVVPLVYCPSPPVPPSYWTTAEDDLMLYGISRHGTNWRLIAETLLFSRNATQIANRYKNVNARGRAVDQVLQATEEGAWPEPQPGRGGGAAAGTGAAAGGARKPKAPSAPAPAPAARPQARAPGLTAGATMLAAAAAAGPAAAAALLQPAVAGAAAAPAALPDVAAIVQAARLIGLPPAVTAAHILQTTQQQLLRAQPAPPPPPPPPPPQVPLQVALHLVAQLQKPGSMTGPKAVAARLLASQLQEPSTAPAAIAALQRAAEHLTLQPPMAAAPPSAAPGVVGACPATAGGERSGGGVGATAEPSLLAIAAQLLQSGTGGGFPAQQPSALAAQLGLPPPQQQNPVPPMASLTGGTSTLPGMPAPATAAALQQLLPALLSMAQPAAPGAAASALLGPVAAAAAAATAAGVASQPPQPWAPPTMRLPSDTSGAAAAAAAGMFGAAAQHHALPSGVGAGAAGHPFLGAAAPAALAAFGGQRSYSMDLLTPSLGHEQALKHDHDVDRPDEPMIWDDSPPPSPGPPAAEAVALPAHGPLGGGVAPQYGVSAHLTGAPGAPAVPGPQQVQQQQHPVSAHPWQQQPHSQFPGVAAAPAAGAEAALAAGAEAAAAPAAMAGAYTGPTDPRLAHGRDPAAYQALPHAALGPVPAGGASPNAHLLQVGPLHHHHRHQDLVQQDHDQHQHNQQHQQQHQQQELPTLSDNFTLGGLSDLLTYGGLKSGAATPATCFSPQGGLASAGLSHGHTVSLLLGSDLGLSELLRSDADGAASGGDGTPTKSAAAGPLRATSTAAAAAIGGGGGNPRSARNHASGERCGRRQGPGAAQATTTADVGTTEAAAVGEVLGTPRREPPPPPPQLLDQQCMQQNPRATAAVHQLLSPMSPTSAGGGGALRNRQRADGATAAAAQPHRLATLRGGVDAMETPSSDPKAKRRSRIANAAAESGARRETTTAAAMHVVEPSPYEGTAQNDHREGGGAAAAAAAAYRPRPPLFVEEGGGSGGGMAAAVGATAAQGQPQQRCAGGEGLRMCLERSAPVGDRGEGDDDEGEAAAEGLARARKRLRLDVDDDEGGGAAKNAAPFVAAAARGGQMLLGLEPDAAGGAAGGDVLRGHCSAANSVAASPVRPTASVTRGSSGAAAAAAASAAAAAATAAAAAGKVAELLESGQVEPSEQQAQQQKQAQQHSTGTGSSGGSKRRSGSAATTTSGASTKRVAVARGQASGRASSVPAAATTTAEPGCAGAEVAAGVPAAPPTGADAAAAAEATGEVGGRQACRLTGQKRGRAGAGQKPARAEKDKAQRGGAAGSPGEPLAVVDANVNAFGVAEVAAAAGFDVVPDGACAVAGVANKPPGQRQHTSPPAAIHAVGKGARPAGAGNEPAAPAPAAKPPKAPARRNAGGAGAQRLTRASAAAAAGAATAAHARPPLPPSARPQLPSAPSPGPLQLSPPHRVASPLPASEVSCGTLGLHSLLLGGDNLDISSLLPCISTRSLAAVAATNPCSPPGLPRAATPAPAARALPGSATAAAAAARAAAPLPPPAFASPPHSQLLQLTPFAASACTLNTLDILPLFSGSSMNLWNALQVGSACGTTSRAPGASAVTGVGAGAAARVVAGSTAAGDGDGGGTGQQQPLRASGVLDTTQLDPWSRFMAACSPTSQPHSAAAAPAPPLPSLPSGRHQDFSLTAFHSHLFHGAAGAPPAQTAAEGDAGGASASAAITAAAAVMASADVDPDAGRAAGPGGAHGSGDGAGGGGAAENAAPPASAGVAVARIAAVAQPQAHALGERLAAAAAAAAAAAPVEAAGDRPSACGDAGLRPADEAQPPPPLPLAPGPIHAGAAEVRPEAGAAAAARVAGVEAELRSPTAAPASHQHPARHPDEAAAAVGPAKPTSGALPPLPPPVPRPGPAPSPVGAAPLDASRLPAPETVRLFGRTVSKPLPITSPTMPAPPPLLRSKALAAQHTAAAAAAVRALQLPAPECPAPPQQRGLAVDVNSNSRSRSQPELAADPSPGQQPDAAPLQQPHPPPLHTPANRPAGAADGSGGGLLRRMLSPHNDDHGPGAATPSGAILDTPMLLAAAGVGAPTPMQPPRAAAAAAAAAAAQQTPAAVAPFATFAIPDTHPNTVAAPLSLTPLPSLAVETAARTVGRRGPWDGRRPHAGAAPGTWGPSISHWASNEPDPTGHHDVTVPGSELLERQGSGCWRPGGGAAAGPSSLYWRSARAAAHAAAAGAGGGAETPGHFTCYSKVARRGVAAVASVNPLVLPSPSVMQPTPRARLSEGDEAEGQEEVQEEDAAETHGMEEDEKAREGEETEEAEAEEEGRPQTEEEEEGEGVVGAGRRETAALGDDGEEAEDGGDRQEADDGGDEQQQPQRELAEAAPAAAEPAAAVAAAAGLAGMPQPEAAAVAPATAGAPQPPQVQAAAPPLTAAVAPAAAAEAPLSWSKEQDQLVVREIFRLGKGPSTWTGISEQLGGGPWSVGAVEARGKLLMARMMALM